MIPVQVTHVSKRFGPVQAVKDVSFEVHSGEIFGLLGPNGAGKTTTIRMMLNIFRPDSGTISVLGGPMSEEKKRHIGYLPEERGLYRELSLLECLVYLARLKGVSRADADRNVRRYLEELDLADWSGKKVKELSRGMQQKAQLIATLAHEPELLILDEPFSGLDPVNTRRVKEVMEEQRAAGRAIIMSTHQMHQVEALCDRILLVNRGEGVLYGNLAEIREHYAGNSVRVRVEGTLDSIPGVVAITSENGAYHLTLEETTSPQEVLNALCRRPHLKVRSFEVAAPSLDDIFISVVTGAGGPVPELSRDVGEMTP
ncbi:MAG: ATP-binding cassette domain-containing protein [Anaerolineae bacterium]|nr:ATP-binding cassette domain-containing protein [Anaerolineae bacterium]